MSTRSSAVDQPNSSQPNSIIVPETNQTGTTVAVDGEVSVTTATADGGSGGKPKIKNRMFRKQRNILPI